MTETPLTSLSRSAEPMKGAGQGLENLPGQVLQRAMEACGASNGSLFLLDGERVTHRILAHPGSFPEVKAFKVERALSRGLAGWALRHRQGALSADVRNDERWLGMGEGADDTGSAIAMPVRCCGREIAVLTLHHRTAYHFTEAHLAAVAAVAERVAGMVEAYRLGLRLVQVRRELEGLVERLAEPALVLGPDGTLGAANDAALREFAISPDESRIGGLGRLEPMRETLSAPADGQPLEIGSVDGRYRVSRFGFPGQGTILLFTRAAN